MSRLSTSPGSQTFYQLFDLMMIFIAVFAAILVTYLFRMSTDKFIYAACAFIVVYGIIMLYVSNKTEFMRCLGNDMIMYKIIRYATLAMIFLAYMVALAVFLVSRDKKPAAPGAPPPQQQQMAQQRPPMGQPQQRPSGQNQQRNGNGQSQQRSNGNGNGNVRQQNYRG